MADIEFFYDFTSPYSYLASTQVARVAERAGVLLHPRPFVLGAVFKATGNDIPARIPAKAAHMLNDLAAWARDYDAPFHFPQVFPVNAIKALRLVIAAGERDAGWQLAQRVFRAYWADGKDIAELPVLAALVTESGLDAGALFSRIEQQEVKDALRRNTDDAIERGAFGAPTFFVNGQMFVGNDRLAFVERAAKGERLYRD